MAGPTNINNESLRFAGDVNVDYINIISAAGTAVDITSMVTEIQIFEDMFRPCTTGTLSVRDSQDLVNLFPFIGEERLQLIIKTPGLPSDPANQISKEFYIYKLSDRMITKNTQVFYMLHFCSLEMIVDANVKISKTYNGKISDIIVKLLHNEGLTTGLPVVIDDTVNSIKYISNYWSPYKNISFLTNRAISRNKNANYVFFENRYGLNFVSLDTLFGQAARDTYTYDKFAREYTPNSTVKNIGKEYARFVDYRIESAYDYIQKATSGGFASKMISYDITTKKYSTKNYTMFDSFDTQVHLNKYPIATEEIAARVNSNIYNYPKYNSTFNGFGDDESQKWLQNRISLMSQLNSFRLTAEIAGRTDLTVGQVINVVLYKITQISKEDPSDNVIDNVFSGNYLITAMNHRIVSGKHEIHMELLKDSLLINPMTGKL